MMKKVLVLMTFMLLAFSQFATAEGDKVRDANQVIGDGCLYSIPDGIDPMSCEPILSPSSLVYFLKCTPELIVWCVGEDNPSSDGNQNPNNEDEDGDGDS